MAKREKTDGAVTKKTSGDVDKITEQLIKDINSEFGLRVAYNLSEQTAPTIVKRWIPTGSIQLDYAIRNSVGGGYPEGRIIEVTALPAGGKSHLAFHAAANVQAMGGLVVYIDTENALMIEKLQEMGIDIRKRFVYVDQHCTEDVFKVIESVILKAKQMQATKDVPILVVWDSIAASSPRAELDGDYDQTTVGLQARSMSKGMRKITGVIGQNNVTLLCLNQLRDAIGVTHGDPLVSPGGKAVPFHSSVRVRLSSGNQVKDGNNVIGIHVIATVKKNKVAMPHRKYEFDIIFGKGIVEHEYIFDEVRAHCDSNKVTVPWVDANGNKKSVNVNVSGTGGWKSLQVSDVETGEVIIDKSFTKSKFNEVMADPQYKPFIDAAIDAAYTIRTDAPHDEGEAPDADDGEEAA